MNRPHTSLTVLAAVAAVLLPFLALMPAATAKAAGDVLEPGDVLTFGPVELKVAKVGQDILRVADLRVHTDATNRPENARLCTISTYGDQVAKDCRFWTAEHRDHWDLRMTKTAQISYDSMVRYRYDDATSGVTVLGREVLEFPSQRVQSRPEVYAQLYAKGERTSDEPIAICVDESLRLRGAISTWDYFLSTANFHGTPYQVQFRKLHTDAWLTVQEGILDGSGSDYASTASLVASDRDFLLVHPQTTGRWRIYRPPLEIDGFTFPESTGRLGLAKVVACV